MIDTPLPMLTSRHGNCAGGGFGSNESEYCGGFGEGRGNGSVGSSGGKMGAGAGDGPSEGDRVESSVAVGWEIACTSSSEYQNTSLGTSITNPSPSTRHSISSSLTTSTASASRSSS